MKIKVRWIEYLLLYILIISSLVFKALGLDIVLIVITYITALLFFLDRRKNNEINESIKVLVLFFGCMLMSTLVGVLTKTAQISGIFIDITIFCFVYIGVFSGMNLNVDIILDYIRRIFFLGVYFALLELIIGENLLLPFFYVDNISINSRICSIYVHPVIAACFFGVSFWFIIYSKTNGKYGFR